MFSKTARYYDDIYSSKDYRAEASRVVTIVRDNVCSESSRLLDVACGTGCHIEYLRQHFDIDGLDLTQELLDIAHTRNPGISFYHADMVDFSLDQEYDAVICLFSSIGYVKTLDRLHRAVACMVRHLRAGGLLLIEPWFTPDSWRPGSVHAILVDRPDLKIARVNTSFVDGRLSYFDLHYLIGTSEGTEHLVERHELGLFERDEMRAAFADAGLDVDYDAEGLTGRGLYIARKPL
jgi:SAM-dependent methyltransferase